MVMPQRRERVVPRLIEEEMRDSFLDYSMSVIVQRALPDVRDGLKPVHRRILYAMSELGLGPARPYKKSANVVGEVLGKYHPHGDSAVYDAMVRMVQDFSLRYPLVDGQGNFGSIDGDNAAAYRYTEARLEAIASELLADLDRETVDFARTFDDQRDEPVVLPSRLPNLLINGSAGIAVGMATNVPPHNLREVATALRHLVENPDCEVDDLIRHVPGPDFPTGGFIIGTAGIMEAYRSGRGRMTMRARVQRESKRGGKEQLVVTELPYGINKSRVLEQIADLVRQKKLEDVSDLRDESDRDGMRIVIELKRGAKVPPILSTLYQKTYLQATFGAIMLALDHGVPREMNLKELLEKFRDHRLEVIQRRAAYDLEQAKAEAHVTEGLIIALDNIDEVIRIIRDSRSKESASERLQERFELSGIQADAILNMRLHRLTELETKELKDRLTELKQLIEELYALLDSESQQLAVLLAETGELVDRYGDGRRTTIVQGDAEFKLEDMVAEEDVVVTVSHQGYIKRMPVSLYRRRVTSGKALAGMERHEDDFLEHVFIASTHDVVLVITAGGQAYEMAVLDIPEGGRASRGRALGQLLGFDAGEGIAALIPMTEYDAATDLIFLTRAGLVKRTRLSDFANIRAGGIIAVSIRPEDELLDVRLSSGGNDVVLATAGGRAIRFPETEIPQVGRSAQGVIGVRMKPGDAVVGMVVVRREATLACVTAGGFAKRTPVGEFRVQGRGGQGTVALSVSERTGPLVAAKELLAGDELMVVTAGGLATRLRAEAIPVQGRATQGKAMVRVPIGDRVVEVSRVASERDSEAKAAVEAAAGAADQLELVAPAESDRG
jgi:DNA gyrase subunit A